MSFLLLSSCNENIIFEEQNNFSDFAYSTSLIERINSAPYTMTGLELGEVISFMDCSMGDVSRRWSINDPSSGSRILKSGFSVDATDFTSYIIGGSNDTSTDANFYIWHKEPGDVEVTIKKEFLFPVSHTCHEIAYDNSSDLISIASSYNSTTKLYDFSFTFSYRVYDKLGIDCVLYLPAAPTDFLYWVLQSDDENLASVDIPSGAILKVTSIYGDPTLVTIAGDDYGLVTPFEVTLTKSNPVVKLTRESKNYVPTNSRTITLPITIY